MGESALILAGRGFYSIPEASRLTDLPVATIRRYAIGYDYVGARGPGHSQASFHADLVSEGSTGARRTLSFLDLIELRMVRLFREQGISGAEIREAEKVAASRLKVDHPFATGRFRTLGKSILVEAGESRDLKRLVEIARSQELLSKVIEPITREVKYEGETPVLWTHPRGGGLVLLDPHRSFGHPIVAVSGVPTHILAEAASSWGPIESVARWYEVGEDEVRAALEFEGRKAA